MAELTQTPSESAERAVAALELPAELDPTKRLVAALIARGMKRSEVARQLRLNALTVKKLEKDPDVQDLVLRLQSVGASAALMEVMGLLHDEAAPSLRRIAELRDLAEESGVQLQAARYLAGEYLDRALPKKGEAEEGERVVRVTIGDKVRGDFERAIAEAGIAVEVSPKAQPDPEDELPPPQPAREGGRLTPKGRVVDPTTLKRELEAEERMRREGEA